ncbi:hypothetical protein PV410_29280 [Streptomyces sp. PA03-5A]|nr:hypothetical protein [Streptomyces sp. PA03-5A]
MAITLRNFFALAVLTTHQEVPTMTRKTRSATAAAIGLGIALAATGRAGSGDTGSKGGSSGGKVTLSFWENAQPGPGEGYWKAAVKEYHSLHHRRRPLASSSSL